MVQQRYPDLRNEQLVLGALVGDLRSFDELVRRFRGIAIAVARETIGSREAAEDIAQESLLLAFKALPQLDDLSKFGSWLCAITRHRARRVAVQSSRTTPTEPSELDRMIIENSEALSTRPPDPAEMNEEYEGLNEALEQLPAEYALTLRLYYFEELQVREIADLLSLPATTIKWRLHRGRELMRRQLDIEYEENDYVRQ